MNAPTRSMRLQLFAPWNMVEFLYMMMCVGLTVTMARYDDGDYASVVAVGARSQRFAVFLMSTRILLLLFYAFGSLANHAARKMGLMYLTFLATSSVLCLVAAATDQPNAYMPIFISISAVEWLMYPLSLFMVYALPKSPRHLLVFSRG